LFIASVPLGLFVCGITWIVVQDHEHGKVVRSDVRKAAKFNKKKMLGCKYVIQRVAHKTIFGVIGGYQAPAYSWVEQSTDPLKKMRSARPGHVVEIAGDDHRNVPQF
jgi:hypothetical protein